MVMGLKLIAHSSKLRLYVTAKKNKTQKGAKGKNS